MSKTNTIYTRENPYSKEWETCIKEMPMNSSIIIGDKTGGRFKPTYQVDRLVTNYVIYSLEKERKMSLEYGTYWYEDDIQTEQMTISEVIEYIKK
jgi:hypothetical protein